MIPQRNISPFANRLARAGGRRIPESVLERDYCLAWLLSSLAESDLRGKLGFKGGTALKRCYFGDYRFSEDLDFTLLEPTPFEDLRLALEPVYAGVREASGIEFAFDREDRHSHANSYTFYLRCSTQPLQRRKFRRGPLSPLRTSLFRGQAEVEYPKTLDFPDPVLLAWRCAGGLTPHPDRFW